MGGALGWAWKASSTRFTSLRVVAMGLVGSAATCSSSIVAGASEAETIGTVWQIGQSGWLTGWWWEAGGAGGAAVP